MIVDIAALGLKTSYDFKETSIPTSRERSDIHQKLREVIAPTISDLESQKLINGFHHTIHEDIDLRLSCVDWPKHKSRIREVLSIHSIAPDLKDWGPMPLERYGGEIGVLLCYNNLEFNSRLSLSLVELISKTGETSLKQWQERLCPHQWIHYLCNQYGFLNLDQITFEINDAFEWLQAFVTTNTGNPQVISYSISIINKFREVADRFEEKFLNVKK